jgi:hypothetical protein
VPRAVGRGVLVAADTLVAEAETQVEAHRALVARQGMAADLVKRQRPEGVVQGGPAEGAAAPGRSIGGEIEAPFGNIRPRSWVRLTKPVGLPSSSNTSRCFEGSPCANSNQRRCSATPISWVVYIHRRTSG